MKKVHINIESYPNVMRFKWMLAYDLAEHTCQELGSIKLKIRQTKIGQNFRI